MTFQKGHPVYPGVEKGWFKKGSKHSKFWLDKHRSKSTKEKIRRTLKQKGISPPDYTKIKKGQHISPKTEFTSKQLEKMWKIPYYRRAFTQASKNNWKKSEYREKTIKAILKGLLIRPTSLEKQFIEIIQKNNLPFTYCGNGGLIIGYKNPDFYETNGKKICIEVANRFHHQGDWAKKRIEHFAKYSWKCLVFFASERNGKEMKFDDSEETIIEKIKEVNKN